MSGAGEWYVFAVRPGAEFLTARVLAERGLETFAPGWKTWTRPHPLARRKRAHTRPALPGYVLANLEGARAEWGAVFTLDTVRGVLGDADGPHQLSEGEMLSIRALKEIPPRWLSMKVEPMPASLCGGAS